MPSIGGFADQPLHSVLMDNSVWRGLTSMDNPSSIIVAIAAAPLFVPWEQLWEVENGFIFIFADEVERISWSKVQLPCPLSLFYNKDENGLKRLKFAQI